MNDRTNRTRSRLWSGGEKRLGRPAAHEAH